MTPSTCPTSAHADPAAPCPRPGPQRAPRLAAFTRNHLSTSNASASRHAAAADPTLSFGAHPGISDPRPGARSLSSRPPRRGHTLPTGSLIPATRTSYGVFPPCPLFTPGIPPATENPTPSPRQRMECRAHTTIPQPRYPSGRQPCLLFTTGAPARSSFVRLHRHIERTAGPPLALAGPHSPSFPFPSSCSYRSSTEKERHLSRVLHPRRSQNLDLLRNAARLDPIAPFGNPPEFEPPILISDRPSRRALAPTLFQPP